MSDPIRVVRNEQGNCVNFIGTTNPAYWNACLSAIVDDEDPTRINVVNNIRTEDSSDPVYEFYKIPYLEFADKDGNTFATAQETADYITATCSVIGVSANDNGTDLTGESVCFSLDATSTSILFDIGYSYGVNTIKAVPNADGTIHITSILGERTLYSGLEAGLACKADGSVIPGGLNDVANYLNELFTVGPFESVVISDPYSTMVADVGGVDAGYTLVGNDAIDPVGPDIFGNSKSSNMAGLKSVATIDQAGEYFTFDIRGEGQIGFGLVHTQASFDAGHWSGNQGYANPVSFAGVNSAHYGFQFSHWFHPTPNGSWTNYGANTAYSLRPGWSNWDQKQDWIDGNPVKIRVGIDANGFISIESKQNDGTYVVHSRTTYPVPQGSEFHLGIKTANSAGRVFSAPKVHLLEPAAPTMQFRYIESPDGVFHYPLFATEEEANYYDEFNSIQQGTGTNHPHDYVDDPTGTTWYMPDNGRIMNGSTPPQDANHLTFLGNPVTYTEITSLTDSELAPPAFVYDDITVAQGDVINIQTQPQDTGYVTTIFGLPFGVISFAGIIQGTVGAAPGTYTVVVTRTNSYGSTLSEFDIIVTASTPPTSNSTPWTKALDFSGSAERALQVSTSSSYNPLMMGGLSSQVVAPTDLTKTASANYSRPWATACVFKYDGHNSNQHIWNAGEGVNGDNIYLRMSSNGYLYFGWGRDGTGINECSLGGSLDTAKWWGVYIAHNGTRLNASNATAANLADAFDIYLMRLNDAGTAWTIKVGTITAGDGNRSIASNWTQTGYRMDRATTGQLSIGGRGANRSFHGKIASMVVTTLKVDEAMPTTTEVEKMITDPVGWLNTYKVGYSYRFPTTHLSYNGFSIDSVNAVAATQVWLMGDGNADSYSNMIRNIVRDADQNYTKLNLISMVSNDIQNVTIPGLT